MSLHRSFLVTLPALLLATVVACSSTSDPSPGGDGGACKAGEQQPCTCTGVGSGTQTCVNGRFAACACVQGDADASVGADAGGGDSGRREGGASTADAGFGQYLGACNVDGDCPTGHTCFSFNTKGKLCTKTCSTLADCPAPAVKCNPRMLCAPPD